MKIAIVFPGQGTQYTGMGKDIFDSYSSARRVYDIASKVLNKNMIDLCHNESLEVLSRTENTQIALLTTMLSYYSIIEKYDHHFYAFAGFSLGEYAALVASQVLSIEKCIEYVNKRALFMSQSVSPGKTGMLAVLTNDVDGINKHISYIGNTRLAIANYNCPGQFVISGYIDALLELKEKLKSDKVRSMIIPVSIPAHCDILKPVSLKMAEIMNVMYFRKPKNMLYMNVDGSNHDIPNIILENIISQIYKPVQWHKTLLNMWDDGIDTFIECGPGNTLSNFIKRTLPCARVYSINDLDSLRLTLKFLEDMK